MNGDPTHVDLFSGIGGFAIAAGWAGFETIAFCEINAACRKLLQQRFPGQPIIDDIRQTVSVEHPPDLLTGGDPCPKHSRARSNGDSNHPDLSGYFLALVGRWRPRWVVRENVPAPTVEDFSTAMEHLGYGTVIIRADAATFTAQSRQGDFVVGSNSLSRSELRGVFSEVCSDGSGSYETRLGTREVAPALTTHRTRYDSRDCYIYEPERLRILESNEREALAGFPDGWTAGFSPATRATMLGNSVVPKVVFELLRMIRKEIC